MGVKRNLSKPLLILVLSSLMLVTLCYILPHEIKAVPNESRSGDAWFIPGDEKPGHMTNGDLILQTAGTYKGQVSVPTISFQRWDVGITCPLTYMPSVGGRRQRKASPLLPLGELSSTVGGAFNTDALLCETSCDNTVTKTDSVVTTTEVVTYFVYLPLVAKRHCYCAPNEVANSCFNSPCDFVPAWGEEGTLNRAVVAPGEDDYLPFGCCSALLGDPSYSNQQVPVGSAIIFQTITVPDTQSPRLEFVYAMYSYDILVGQTTGKLYDSFEVAVFSPYELVIFRTGNPEGSCPGDCRHEVWSSGIRAESLDFSKFAGQTITLYFSIWNRVDSKCNTWVYIDAIRVLP